MMGRSRQAEFALLENLGHAYTARDSDGLLSLLIPVQPGRLPLNRATGELRLRFESAVDFRWARNRHRLPAAILQCTSQDLEGTFSILAADIVERFSEEAERPTARAVAIAVQDWENLLRQRRSLTRSEVVGLWGELWILSQMPSIDMGLAAWNGPDESQTDFFGGGVGVEVKTSFQSLEHHFSLAQLDRPRGDADVYIVSIWVENDAADGQTLLQLVDLISSKVADRARFEAQLLTVGFSRRDSAAYDLSLRCLERPAWFEASSIPRVHQIDPGVSRVTYVAKLDRRLALSGTVGIQALARLCRDN